MPPGAAGSIRPFADRKCRIRHCNALELSDGSSAGPFHAVSLIRKPLDHRIASIPLNEKDTVFFSSACSKPAFDIGAQAFQSSRMERKAVHRGDGLPLPSLGFAADTNDTVARGNGWNAIARAPIVRTAAGRAHPAMVCGIHDSHQTKFSKILLEMQVKSCLDNRTWNSYTFWKRRYIFSDAQKFGFIASIRRIAFSIVVSFKQAVLPPNLRSQAIARHAFVYPFRFSPPPVESAHRRMGSRLPAPDQASLERAGRSVRSGKPPLVRSTVLSVPAQSSCQR